MSVECPALTCNPNTILPESIYNAFEAEITPGAISYTETGTSSPSLSPSNPYIVNTARPIGWGSSLFTAAAFYLAGVYSDLHGFKHVPERTALQQFQWEFIQESIKENPVESSETGRLGLPARGVKSNLKFYVRDLDSWYAMPRDRRRLIRRGGMLGKQQPVSSRRFDTFPNAYTSQVPIPPVSAYTSPVPAPPSAYIFQVFTPPQCYQVFKCVKPS